MGFNLVKAVSRAVGIPDKYSGVVGAVFPALIATDVAVSAIQKIGSSALSQSHAPAVPPGSTQFTFQNPYQQPALQPYAVQPTGFSDFSQQSFAPTNIPDFSQEGPQPWDYSTPLPAYSTIPPQERPMFSAMPVSSPTSSDPLTTVAEAAALLFL